MDRFPAEISPSALVAVVQKLLASEGVDDVRAGTAHGARLIAFYESLTLYEAEESGDLTVTLRRGDQLGSQAAAVEELLCGKAAKTGRTVSTLDACAAEREQALVDEYAQRLGLCLVRPLHAYGELMGLLALHFHGRSALADSEFNALRRYVDCAAAALSNARTRAQLREYAFTDPLTGLANRRRLESEFARARGREVSLLLIDFDGLKLVNDMLGYERGDALIAAVGAKLAASTMPGESVIRFGGDEFVIVLPEQSRESAVARAEGLTAMLDAFSLPLDLARYFRGASVGWATAEAGEDLWEVLHRASGEMRSRKRRRKADRELLGDGDESSAGPHLAGEL